MYTQCPKCQTVFAVTEQHLAVARGRVRCSHCQHIFNARLRLIKDLAAFTAQQAAIQADQQQTSLETEATEEDTQYIDLAASQPDRSEQPIQADQSPQEQIPEDKNQAVPIIETEVSEPESSDEDEGEVIIEIDSEPAPIVDPAALRNLQPELNESPISASPTSDPEQAPEVEPEPAPEPEPIAESTSSTKTGNDGLDAIFAALDNRLEALADKADDYVAPLTLETGLETPAEAKYTDTFDQPDDQPEDTESADTVFAAAEAELDSQLDAQSPLQEEDNPSDDAKPDADLESTAEEILDNMFAADDEQVPDIDLESTESDELVFLDEDAGTETEPEPEREAEERASAEKGSDSDKEEADDELQFETRVIDIPAESVDEPSDVEQPAEEFVIMEPIHDDEKEDETAESGSESVAEEEKPQPRIKQPDELFSELIMPGDGDGDTSELMDQEELPFTLRNDVEELQKHTPRSGWMTLLYFVLFLLFLTLLAGQLALFRNVELANKVPELRPWLKLYCEYLPCQFSGRRDISRIQILNRDVRSHPKEKNALLITAVFVNNAGYPQPYPDIMVRLSDLTSTLVAQRRFKPADYLAKSRQDFQLMKPGVPMQVSLEVLDPGNDAVNFEFSFK